MSAPAALARPGLALAAIHDDRHELGSQAFARESVPYLVNLPEHGVAFFTYTWVDRLSNAGAALAIFGPGIGTDPIQQRIADRPVPPDMSFAAWKLGGLSMSHDLKFGAAHVRWEHPQAIIDFTFESLHPPYSYASHKEGCPPFAASNRIEQAGRVKGTLRLGERVIEFDTTGHRDHSWGTRDWRAMQHYKWFHGQTSDGVALHFWHLQALGNTFVRGYVFKDRILAEVADVRINWQVGADYWHKQFDAVITDEIARTTTVAVSVSGHYTLIPDPAIVLREGAGRATIDGKPGVGWMEVAWPQEYLEHILANSPH
jgi:hypothetical protein